MPIPKSKYKSGKLLWHDPQRGMAAYWHWDAQENKGRIEEVWDARPVIAKNSALLATELERAHVENPDMRYIGSVPMGEMLNWVKQGKIGPDWMTVKDQPWIKKKLNDPKYRKFRANSKRL